MIESIEFKNFKSLRDTTLPLGPCTILVGPNGSGKSTVLQALEAASVAATPQSIMRHKQQKEQLLAAQANHPFQPKSQIIYSDIASFGIRNKTNEEAFVKLFCHSFPPIDGYVLKWSTTGGCSGGVIASGGIQEDDKLKIEQLLSRIRVYSLDADKIAGISPVQGSIELTNSGSGLASVLDAMRDEAPEQFKAIENQIGQWLPEFDRILFDRPQQGCKSIALRTKEGQYKVPATDLSQGTLVSLALLTLAYHPKLPSLIALEEPDRGMHPFLLRHVKDALIRLSHPESFGEDREPIQVIATTHSPYFLDLFRETPEYVVVANKVGLDVQFQRLTDQPNASEIIGDAALGDAWFSGILGGVPSGS